MDTQVHSMDGVDIEPGHTRWSDLDDWLAPLRHTDHCRNMSIARVHHGATASLDHWHVTIPVNFQCIEEMFYGVMNCSSFRRR